MKLLVFLCLFGELVLSSLVTDSSSFVTTVAEGSVDDGHPKPVRVNPHLYSMEISSQVSNRFATTLITSKVKNLVNTSKETTFSVVLPENAFISKFEMDIDGKIYKAHVKEKEEAKQIYQQAVAKGQSAGHVELSARDSKTFTVSANVEPNGVIYFMLTYEELLQRKLGQYELVVNIHPGQIVPMLFANVHINESRPLKFVRVPSLRTGNEIGKNDPQLDPLTDIKFADKKAVIVKFNPSINQQKEFAEKLGGDKEKGLACQFVVQYDVERDPQGGEVLVKDGYFVHFFAPTDLKPLPKHVVFVLDHSGSMQGRNIEQLIEAMQFILSDLKAEDLFNIVRFSDEASVWNAENNNKFDQVNFLRFPYVKYGHLEPQLREANLPEAVQATPQNTQKAKEAINDTTDMGSTNMIAGLEVGLFLIKRTQEKIPNKYQPMIVFLTDGYPNAGLRRSEDIVNTVNELNSGTHKAALFSLSFGDSARKDFLRNLSSQNLGFSRHIYEASDASLQLRDFYKTISTPLLSNITFNYVDTVSDLTEIQYPIFFEGSELVVAGRTEDDSNTQLPVVAICWEGPASFVPTRREAPSSLERLWAYLTVKQILAQSEVVANNTDLKKKALDLALKYSFVTEVSSLVVVKPDGNSPSDEDFPRGSTDDFVPHGFGSASLDIMSLPEDIQILPTNQVVPKWLDDLKTQNGNITTPQGTFKLGKTGDVVTKPECPSTPLNGTGVCTLVFDCPQMFSWLTDVNVYLKWFCPLDQFAGVCCPTF